MILSNEKPPVYERCHKVFGADWDKGITITYGDSVHCKFDISQVADLLVHERVHIRQQTEMGKDIWWERYFTDKEFRLSQEIEAYKAQIAWMRIHYPRKKRKDVERFIYELMVRLYNFCETEKQAKELLK